MQSIHCKVFARGSIRRFAIPEAKYSLLHQHVVAVFGIDSNWVVKYKDEEDTLVTISSDEELTFAVELMGSPLHLVIVEPSERVSKTAEPVERGHHKRANKFDKERVLAHLTKKQANITTRLSTIKESENPRQRANVSKLEQKLANVSAKIVELSEDTTNPAEKTSNSNVTDIAPAALEPITAVVPSFDKNLMKAANQKFLEMRRDFQKEQKRIHSLVEVVKALKTISRFGVKAHSPVQVDSEQAQLAASDLVASRKELSIKKEQLKKQAELVKQFHKQRNSYVRSHKHEKAIKDRKHCKKHHDSARPEKWQEMTINQEDITQKEEKLADNEAEKLKHQADKAVRLAEKTKREELKAARFAAKAEHRAQKAAKHAHKASFHEEKAGRKAEKIRIRDEKRKHQNEMPAEAVDPVLEEAKI